MKEVFVFGSNLAGRHGKGAALHAAKEWGAVYGQAEGRMGDAYAIPTKDRNFGTLPAFQIEEGIKRFADYARSYPDVRFLITPIGTGLAGIPVKTIWRAFVRAEVPGNCVLTASWMNPAIIIGETPK